MRRRQWYYRGALRSCNYSCNYCPFSKKKGSEREQREDERALNHFVEKLLKHLETCGEEHCAVQIVPYGEALIHPYYWREMAILSRNPKVDAVGAQSNLSFSVERMLGIYQDYGGDLQKLLLWGTFHPQMTTVEEFCRQCKLLEGASVRFCVGAVGVPEQLEQLRKLRQMLPEEIYFWINRMDGLGRPYTTEEVQAFLELDDYFELELMHHPSDMTHCADNYFVEADGTVRRCNLCRMTLGNLYQENFDGEQKNTGMEAVKQRHGRAVSDSLKGCGRKECSCYLSYCNRQEEQLLFFKPYPAFRIPVYPKAVFFDVDGTLVLDKGELPEEYTIRLKRLAKHCKIYLATSLPCGEAMKKCASVKECLSGGVFANGGRWMVWETSQEAEVNGQNSRNRRILQDEICGMDACFLPKVKALQGTYHYRVCTYQRKDVLYKVTLVFPGGRSKWLEEKQDMLREKLELPASCRIMVEGNCLQITDKSCGKLEGIQKLCGYQGYSMDKIAVFGNSKNDIPMLRAVPFSVAVRGSGEEVRKGASYYF